MYNNLLVEFENLLNSEARRITMIIIDLYKEISFDIEFNTIINKHIKKEFRYYWIDIEIRILNLLFDKGLNYFEEKNKNEKYLRLYAKWCKKDMKNKDHLKGANKLAQIIIDLYKKNYDIEISLAKLVADNN